MFDWNNYIWSCPSCNGLKGNHYPFLDPAAEADMAYIEYCHEFGGDYILSRDVPGIIKDKFALTCRHSNINSKNRPAKRINIYRDANELLREIKSDYLIYKGECIVTGENSATSIKALHNLEQRKGMFLDLLRSGDCLFFIKSLVDDFKSKNDAFPYSFNQLLAESDYLDE